MVCNLFPFISSGQTFSMTQSICPTLHILKTVGDAVSTPFRSPNHYMHQKSGNTLLRGRKFNQNIDLSYICEKVLCVIFSACVCKWSRLYFQVKFFFPAPTSK